MGDREVAVRRSRIRERIGAALQEVLRAFQPRRGDGILHVREVLPPEREGTEGRALVVPILEVGSVGRFAERDRSVGMAEPVRGLGEPFEVVRVEGPRGGDLRIALVRAIPRPLRHARPRLVEHRIHRP